MRVLERLRWKAKQKLAGTSRFYGDGGTWHQTGYLDVETFNGEVVAVWFRCQPLAFQQTNVNRSRGEEMIGMAARSPAPGITGVEVSQ